MCIHPEVVWLRKKGLGFALELLLQSGGGKRRPWQHRARKRRTVQGKVHTGVLQCARQWAYDIVLERVQRQALPPYLMFTQQEKAHLVQTRVGDGDAALQHIEHGQSVVGVHHVGHLGVGIW